MGCSRCLHHREAKNIQYKSLDVIWKEACGRIKTKERLENVMVQALRNPFAHRFTTTASEILLWLTQCRHYFPDRVRYQYDFFDSPFNLSFIIFGGNK